MIPFIPLTPMESLASNGLFSDFECDIKAGEDDFNKFKLSQLTRAALQAAQSAGNSSSAAAGPIFGTINGTVGDSISTIKPLADADAISKLSTLIAEFQGNPKITSAVEEVLNQNAAEVTKAELLPDNTDLNDSVTFAFKPQNYHTVTQRLASSDVKLHKVDCKMLLEIDGFLNSAESEELRSLVKNGKSEIAYPTSSDSVVLGEKPPKRLHAMELYEMLTNAPTGIEPIHKLLSHLAAKFNLHITTHPWDAPPSNPLINNYLTVLDPTSEQLGWHKDYKPESNLTFNIRELTANGKFFQSFENGEKGNPYYLSVIVYATDKNFDSSWGMGTMYKDGAGKNTTVVPAKHGKIAIFEGNIDHAIQRSNIPQGVSTWRNTFVWRIALRSKDQSISVKDELMNFFSKPK